MKQLGFFVIGAVLAIAAGNACAQYVKGNEAVKLMPDGTKRVETPPTAGAVLARPCPAAQAGCAGGGWKMVETQAGLMECTEIYARPLTCRASTFGTEKRSRLWIVKQGSQWLQCQQPDLGSKCVSTKTLAIAVVQ
ncbi:MAG: hypothetical protein KF720_03805 [Rubrivivax sp.]|nr:hypothetical protein [Rubrivivax sp.]